MASGANHPNVKWYGPKVSLKMLGKISKNLADAGKLLQAEVKTALAKPARAFTVSLSASGKKRKRYAKGYAHSRPGEPPRKITGELHRSIYRKLYRKQKRMRVGARVLGLLEKGTKRIKPRPYLMAALNKAASQIAAILTRPIL
jgi:hypothetical protein